MGNIVSSVGTSERDRRRIGDMVAGESGYAVEWAVKDGELNEQHTVGPKGGTASMLVECIGSHQYKTTYEEPVYRNPFCDWHSEVAQAQIQQQQRRRPFIKRIFGLS